MTKETPQSQPQRTPAAHTNSPATSTNAAPAPGFDMSMLQRTVGNQAVQRIIQRKHGEKEGAPKGVPTSWFAKKMAAILFGSEADRQGKGDETPENESATITAKSAKNKIEANLATYDRVSAQSGGNALKGSIYTPKAIPLTGTAVLLLSGSGGSSTQYMPEIAKAYVEIGNVVLMMDYRGFGISKKSDDAPVGSDSPSEAGLYDDAEAMMGLLAGKGFASDNVIVHGYSLGGPIAAELVLRLSKQTPSKKVKGLVLDRAMVSAKKGGAAHGGFGLAGEAAKSVGRFSLKQKVAMLPDDLQILFTYGGASDVLSKSDAELAKATLKSRGSDLIKVAKSDNAGHRDHEQMLAEMVDDLTAMSQ